MDTNKEISSYTVVTLLGVEIKTANRLLEKAGNGKASILRGTVFRDYAKIRNITGAVYNKKTGEWKY